MEEKRKYCKQCKHCNYSKYLKCRFCSKHRVCITEHTVPIAIAKCNGKDYEVR